MTLTRAKLFWPDDWVRASLKRQGLWGALGQQWWILTDSGPRRDKPQTGDRVLGAQGSSMREGNEGYPVWSEPTEGLLWHKPQKILMVVTGGMCHNPQCIAPCCVWGCVAADRSERP